MYSGNTRAAEASLGLQGDNTSIVVAGSGSRWSPLEVTSVSLVLPHDPALSCILHTQRLDCERRD